MANVSCGLQHSPITKHVHTSESKWLWLKRSAVGVFLSGEHYRMQIPGQVWRCRRLGIFWHLLFSVSMYEDRKCKLQMNQPEGLSVIPKQTERAQRGRETPVICLLRLSLTHTHMQEVRWLVCCTINTITWLVLLLILGFNKLCYVALQHLCFRHECFSKHVSCWGEVWCYFTKQMNVHFSPGRW